MAGMPRSFNFDASTGITNGILGTLADGFQVGNSAQVNTAGQTYHYVSFAERAGSMASASYAGNGTNNATVTGLGFQPGYVVVRAADTARPDLAPEAAGLLAASLGLSRMFSDDLAQLDAGMTLYDAFYRWCRDATGETHNWPNQRPGA